MDFIKKGKMKEKAESDMAKASKEKKRKFGENRNDSENQALALSATSSLGTYGDILVAYNASSWGINFGYPGHAAIVSNSSSYTVESYPADGVQKHTNDWGSRQYVYAMHVKGATSTNALQLQHMPPIRWASHITGISLTRGRKKSLLFATSLESLEEARN